MRFITVTELKQTATQIVSEMESTGKEVVVTKKGKPVVLMRLINDEAFNLKEEEKEVMKRGRDGERGKKGQGSRSKETKAKKT